jgi:hypothetical protein
MPRGDGTGPTGEGPKTGKGTGCKAGSSIRLKMQGGGCGQAVGCVCPQCGAKATYGKGAPCLKNTCPQCGAPMVRA